MAEPSRKPTFKGYGVTAVCSNCSRKLTATEFLWFRSLPAPRAVFGYCCWHLAAHV